MPPISHKHFSTCFRAGRIGRRYYLSSEYQLLRSIYGLTGSLANELTLDVKKEIETHWKTECIQQLKLKQAKSGQKYYVLSMFPYPSGNLHMGHVRVYAISDAIARFYHMKGYKVIHPMGWDAFGLPAENAAIERNIHPEVWTNKNISNMKSQLEELRCTFDWNMEFATCDPEYYKWTQHLFLKMYDQGLAYQKEAYVNWDPVDQTVLADEQVDENNCSWRSGAKIEKKLLRQWFLKITQFSKALSDGLEDPILENWRDVVKIQKHWIGDCAGTSFTFKLLNSEKIIEDSITVWTDRPEAIFGVAFINIGPNHPISLRYNSSDKDVRLKMMAIHPFTNEPIPIFICKDFVYVEGSDAHIGIPAINEQDEEFAKKEQLPYLQILSEDGLFLINSKEFSSMNIKEAKSRICLYAQKNKFGGYFTSSQLRDWLISRQRFWGTPIPIVHCPKCNVVPVPYNDLPVLLPKDSANQGNRMKPLSHFKEWIRTNCPRCGHSALRETDTMDTFVDSSWYFLRYLDSHNKNEPFRKELIDENMPVDIYIGGKEHASMHLYYARFVSHFLHGLGLTAHREPFKRLLVQGMVLGQTFIAKDTGRYLKNEEVKLIGDNYVEKGSEKPVITRWEKMSKSRYNGVDPQDALHEYGVDTTRLLMLANFAPTSNRNWPASTFSGILAWQNRLWLTMTDFINAHNTIFTKNVLTEEEFKKHESQLFDCRNFYLKHVTYNFHITFQLSVAISHMQGLTNCLRRMPQVVLRDSLAYERALGVQIIMLAPIIPHFASELWSAFTNVAQRRSSDFKWHDGVLSQSWPTLDESYDLDIVAKVNGIEIHSIKLSQKELHLLTKERAVQLLMNEKVVVQYATSSNLYNIEFRLFPYFEAEVNFQIKGVHLKKKANKQTD